MTQGRYWAFISYSHADEAVATWLHKALETYRLPKKLAGTVQGGMEIPARLFPVFRDRDELASSDSLGAKINDALVRAEALIVIASKKSASSHWVNEEIRVFKALGKGRRVLCVIADGEPFASDKGAPDDECFAPALRRHLDANGQLTDARAEPIAADIRPGKDGRRDALLKLVAGILDIGLDALKQRDLQRRQRRLTAIAAAAVAASVFTTGLSFFAIQSRNEAQAQRRLAEARQTQAEGLIQFLLGDLRKKLEPIGKLDILDAVGEQAMAYFGQVAPEQLSDTELAARAQALRQIGDVRVQQGKLADASPAFREALRLDEELVRRHPGDQQAIFNMAQSEYYIGYDHFERGEFEQTQPWFERYLASAQRLVATAPDNLIWLQELAYARYNMAALFDRMRRYEAMLEEAASSVPIWRSLFAVDSKNREWSNGLIDALSWHSRALREAGRFEEALEVVDEAIEIAKQHLSENSRDVISRYKLASLNNQKATNAFSVKQSGAALEAATEAHAQFEMLLKTDPSNLQWRKYGLASRHYLAQAEVLRGNAEITEMQLVRLMRDCEVLRAEAPDDGGLPRLCTDIELTGVGLELLLTGEAAGRAQSAVVDHQAANADTSAAMRTALLAYERVPSEPLRARIEERIASFPVSGKAEERERALWVRWLELLETPSRQCFAEQEWADADLGDPEFYLFVARRCETTGHSSEAGQRTGP